MIYDKLSNIKNYKEIPTEALDFISSLTPNMSLGRRVISDGIYANIEKYTTKKLSDAKYESHKKYTDIQILLKGTENICYTCVSNLDNNALYNEEKDITFYNEPVLNDLKVILDGSNFVVLYPHEAHAPQISIDENVQEVLKVVVKIKKS